MPGHRFQTLCKVHVLVFEIRLSTTRRILKTNFFLPISMRFKPFLRYTLSLTIEIRLICQKLDLIETESEMYKMGIMQDKLCHPYILQVNQKPYEKRHIQMV